MKVLIDSDALFALYVANDLHHQTAKEILHRFLKEKAELFVTNLVLQETATVISYRLGQKQALDFLKRFSQVNIKQVFVNKNLIAKSWLVFKKQTKKGTSFIDCANIVVTRELKVDKIFSFDRFYQQTGAKI